METAIIVGAVWVGSGVLAYGACLADFYSIGSRFPTLGTADEQWNGTSPPLHELGVYRPDRNRALPLAIVSGLLGPIGLLTVALATKGFKTGFRFW